MPPPPQQRPQSATEREKELIDRRRNWVFMTPEDFAKSGSDKDVSPGSEKNDDGKPTTAMERYYQHLYDLDQASATNQLGNTKLDRDSWATNSSQWNSPRQGDPGFAGSPFNPTADSGFFQPAKADSFVNIFSSDRDPSLPSPEQVREQAEQKAHMDSFKELWDMTPAPASSISTPTPVVTAAPVSGFNTVQSAMQPALNALSPAPANNSSAPLIPRPSVTTMRNVGPPHASFAPPQNPF